jgi:alpha-1,3-rhamnosyl/mannosyltransferase
LLDALYRRALVCCLPSLYEGFGLPALEAMARACPVIVPRGGALEEVVGDAGALIDTPAVDAVAEAIAAVQDDPELRDDLAARGPARAATFSWARSIAAHREAYERARSGS